jgi:hypothetical protein
MPEVDARIENLLDYDLCHVAILPTTVLDRILARSSLPEFGTAR